MHAQLRRVFGHPDDGPGAYQAPISRGLANVWRQLAEREWAGTARSGPARDHQEVT
jgi:hypothetical protein